MCGVPYRTIDNRLADFEQTLNRVDWLPIISTYTSGPLRILVAAVQVIAGAALFVGKMVEYLLDWRSCTYRDMWNASVYIFHGTSNFVRGTVALFPIIGNVALRTFDKVIACRFNYRYERLRKELYPLMTACCLIKTV